MLIFNFRKLFTAVQFQDVCFAYQSRPENFVLKVKCVWMLVQIDY